MLIDAIIWNANPEILPLGPLSLRWYGLLFALGFVFGYLLFQKFFTKENISIELLDKLTVYMALGTIIGARLGHCLFYDPKHYLANPLEILKVWEGGLASHGAAIGILLAIWLFVRKYKASYIWLFDRLVITVALAGALIRTGNLMNSEIYGVSTQSEKGFIYMRDLTRQLEHFKQVEKVSYSVSSDEIREGRFLPVEVRITMKDQFKNEQAVPFFVENNIYRLFSDDPKVEETNFILPLGEKPTYSLSKDGEKRMVISTQCWAVPKYPTHIYEAVAYLFIFLLLLSLYFAKGVRLYKGVLFGLFLLLVFSARFGIEFIKEVQSPFEKGMSLNMGQWLSIPFIGGGLVLLIWAFVKKQPSEMKGKN